VGIARRIRAANAFDASRFVVLRCEGADLGWVRRDFVAHLAAFPQVFRIGVDGIDLCAAPDDHAGRSAAMAEVAQALALRGLLTRWRNEIYRIGFADHGRCFFDLERAAVRFFGFTAQAVHMNGLVVRDGETCMWIARRSANKPIDPGMLDNLTGGGMGGDLGTEQTLVKECWEEAGIPAALASAAVRTGSMRVRREVPDGLHVEIIHLYDLELPADFEPANQDGEVSEFRCLPLAAVAAELAADAPYTIDAGLVAIDCLRRKGLLAS